MNELLDSVWDEIIVSKLAVKGLPNEITHRFAVAVHQHKKPDNKVTLAGVLEDIGEDKIKSALAAQRAEVARREESERMKNERDEVAKQARVRQSAEFAEQKRVEEEAAARKKREQEADEHQKREQVTLAIRQAEPLFVVEHIHGIGKADWPFRYRGPEARDVAAAETALRTSYPGINLNLPRLILAGKAIAQYGRCGGYRMSDPHIDPKQVRQILSGESGAHTGRNGIDIPQIQIVGVPGAGKSVSTRLAAALACSKAVDSHFIKELKDHAKQLLDTGWQGNIALFDEVHSVWPGRLQTHIPRHTSEAVSRPPVIVLAAKQLPPVMLTDAAIARRVILADIGQGARGIAWLETGGPVEQWRDKNPDHADALLSDLLDRFFRGDPPTFEQVAAALGFYPLTQRAELELVEFVAALHAPNKASRFTGPRWRTVPGKGPLRERYRLLLPAMQDRGFRIEQPARDRRTWIEVEQEIIDAAAALPAKKQGRGGSKTDDKSLQVVS